MTQATQEDLDHAELQDPPRHCDLSVVCPHCGIEMMIEHAHMRCTSCGYRDSCCF